MWGIAAIDHGVYTHVASNVEKKSVFDLNDIIWRTSTVILQKTGKAENRIRVSKKRL